MANLAEIKIGGVRLNPDRPAVIVPLYADTAAALTEQAATAQRCDAADLVELRLDPLAVTEYSAAVAAVRAVLTKPLLVTIRTQREGGEAALAPKGYAALVEGLLRQGGFELIDLEWSIGPALLADLADQAAARGIVTVFSSHHFEGTPDTEEMSETLIKMADAGAGIAKLAVMPHTAADAARLLQATADAAARRPATPLLTMSMGALGEITRYCGGKFGSVATFGTLTVSSAPGQPQADRLARVLEELKG